MTTEIAHRRLVLVSERGAKSFARDLRSLGHEVSVVRDLDEAQALMTSGGFDLAVLPSQGVLSLLGNLSASELSDFEAWRQSARAVADDVRQLLSALQRKFELDEVRAAAAELLGRSPGGSEAQASIGAVIGLLSDLLDDLDTGHGAELSQRPLRLEDVVDAAALAVYPAAAGRNQDLAVDIDEDVTHVRADGTKLRRVLSKLLDHASRQGRRSGGITLRATKDQNDCVISLTYEGGPSSLLELRDLFNPSDAAREPGKGLGWVNKLVEVQGGRLWVESQREAETTVFISLPDAALGASAV